MAENSISEEVVDIMYVRVYTKRVPMQRTYVKDLVTLSGSDCKHGYIKPSVVVAYHLASSSMPISQTKGQEKRGR